MAVRPFIAVLLWMASAPLWVASAQAASAASPLTERAHGLQGREAYHADIGFVSECRQRNLASVGVDIRFAAAVAGGGTPAYEAAALHAYEAAPCPAYEAAPCPAYVAAPCPAYVANPCPAYVANPCPGYMVNSQQFDGPSFARRRGAEMRALALYGPLELSTFAGKSTVRWPTRETLFAASSPDRRAEDPWFGFDKIQHFTFSFLWTLGTQYVAVNKGRLSETQALPVSITTSAAIGLTKEIYDLHAGPHRTFSYRDLVANSLGIMLAAGLILL